jgi:hypothetical protein
MKGAFKRKKKLFFLNGPFIPKFWFFREYSKGIENCKREKATSAKLMERKRSGQCCYFRRFKRPIRF